MNRSATGPALSTFAEVTALVPARPGLFGADVSREWTIGGKPNGGRGEPRGWLSLPDGEAFDPTPRPEPCE
jgi:hypothetical protein